MTNLAKKSVDAEEGPVQDRRVADRRMADRRASDRPLDLANKAFELRRKALEMCIKAGDGHVTSSMSCAEILTILYYGGYLRHDPKNQDWDGRDRFILSKAQASPMLYTVLANRG